MNRILLAEDNDNLRELITDFLSEHEYEVDAATAEADCTTLLDQWVKAGIVEA